MPTDAEAEVASTEASGHCAPLRPALLGGLHSAQPSGECGYIPGVPSKAPTITLRTPIDALPAVGERRRDAFRRLGLTNVGRLLAHLPSRVERVESESTIDRLVPGAVVTARGEVTATDVMPFGNRPRFRAVLLDHTGRLDLVFFNALYLRERIRPGMRLRIQGKSRRAGAGLQVANPKWEVLKEGAPEPRAEHEGRWRPVYPAAEDLTSEQIEGAIQSILDDALPLIDDHLPEHYRHERALPSLADAHRMMHRPEGEDDFLRARRRLAYDELLLLQLGVHMKRSFVRSTLRAPALKWSETIDKHIRARLPFTLTPGQEGAVRDLAYDLTKPSPTNRLIQGDVGSGKTVIALYAMLMAVASKMQAALVAPTVLVAEQHYASITEILKGSSVRIELLTGDADDAQRSRILRRIAKGEADIIIGAHSLLTESIRFADLAVAVIDEQHRFGVHQRARLRRNPDDPRSAPHVLVMTATPIPRTLSLTIFGDLDVSTIEGLPPGRKPVKTTVVAPVDAELVYTRVRQRLDKGEQAFIVVPAVDARDLSNVRATLKRLEEGALAGKRLAAVHGRLSRDTREAVMDRFRRGEIDALVATTVVEVGVDVPGATVMVVEQAERFGLAQLHQLRGRVGRGETNSVCYLIAQPTTPDAKSRLDAIAGTNDGFALAERDFDIRGPGELIGSRQSGSAPFRVADLPRDMDLLLMARRDAAAWIERSPLLEAPDEKTLKRRLLKQHGASLGLADVA